MTTFTVETVAPQHAIVVHAEVPIADLPAVFERGFHETMQEAGSQGLTVVGAPFGYYPRMPDDTVEVAVGFPVASPAGPSGDVTGFVLPGGEAVTGTHVGSYDELARTYDELRTWAAEHELELADVMWEAYLSDPEAEPDPATWRTRITWPLA